MAHLPWDSVGRGALSGDIGFWGGHPASENGISHTLPQLNMIQQGMTGWYNEPLQNVQ